MVMSINNSKEPTHLIKFSQALIPAIPQINVDSEGNPIKAAKMEVADISNFYGKFKANHLK